jgi:hypothetical protein
MFDSQMMSEMANTYRRANKAMSDNKRLQRTISRSAAEKLSAEESHAQQTARMQELADGSLAAQLAAEEKLLAAEEQIRLLKGQLADSQDALVAHMEGESSANAAKEKAERECEDLRHQQATQDLLMNDLKAVLEVEAVDRFKRSPAYDALLLREFERGMRQAKKFFALKDHSNEKALRRYDRNIQRHMDGAVRSVKSQLKLWKAHCRYTRVDPLPMHLEIPTKRASNTYYSGQKGSFTGSGAEPDLGPVAGRDYTSFMPEGDEEVVWPSEDEVSDTEEDSGDIPPASV